MSEVLNIINGTLKEKMHETDFNGSVNFYRNDRLDIERDIHNRLINKFNAALETQKFEWRLNLDSQIFLGFVYEVFEDNSDKWTREDRNYYLSTIIHENGLVSLWSEETEGYEKKPDTLNSFGWDNLDFVELTEVDNNICFRFYYKDDTENYDIYSNRFGTFDQKTCLLILDLLNNLGRNKNETASTSIQEQDGLKSKIEDLLTSQNYEAAIQNLEIFKETYGFEDNENNLPFYYQKKSLALCNLGKFDEALSTIETQISFCNTLNEISPNAHRLKGQILRQRKNFLSALNCFAYSEEFFVEETNINESKYFKEETYNELRESFLDLSYVQRKLIFISEEIYATQSGRMVVLKNNDLPLNLNFPVGHPHVNEVYTCHPHKQHFYLPIKDYSEELFLDRVNEFSYLLQCLGATKLDISSTKSYSSDQKLSSNNEIDVNIDYKLNKGKVNVKGENTENTLIDGKLKIAKKQAFKPVKAPFIPTNLVWYHSDLNWQRLVDQRLNGSIVTHSELISSSQSENLSSHELKQIDAELKLLLPKIGVNYSNENEISKSSIKSHEWLVSVEFEDVDNLLQVEQPIKVEPAGILNSDNEYKLKLERYKEDVLLMLEDDGVIDESERNILNRKIKRYGLSEEDATAIENELATSGYAENELNYIEELKEILMDGEINDIERKILDRYAVKFKIEKEKQMEIDTLFIK